jgi:trigger factor
MIRDTANEMLEEYGQQFSSYGITLDQMLQYRGQTRDDAINEMLESAEERLKTRLALQQIVEREQIEILPDEVETEANTMLADYDEATREQITSTLADQFYMSIANTVLDRKLRARLIAIATGEAPELPVAREAGAADESAAEVGAASALEADEPADTAATPPAETAEARDGEPAETQETKTDT